MPYSEMLILYRVKRTHKQSIIDVIKRTLEKEQIPYYWLAEDETTKRKFSRDEETVKISTIESSKGLDFQAVFIVNVDNMPFALEEDREREVSLLYIGMTRAKEYLCLSYSGESEFTRYFEQVRTSRLQKKKERKRKRFVTLFF
ncbi:ATP-dependent helicase/nuclease subunit A [Anoxybacillus sp. BCO1]|nr:ATP-dependent helicase/nuclease subunit A [Anoxybacillus sp. BCO1]